MTRTPAVFYSLSAQPDNLGDIEIRKQVLEWLKESGRPVVLFTGPMPQGYLDGFGDLSGFETHSQSRVFELRLLREALRGRSAVVLAPGPQIFGPTKLAIRSLINLVNVLAIRARRGSAVAVGRSLRGTPSPGKILDRSLIKLFSLYTVRDDVSADAIGLDLMSYPDMAFGARDTSPTTGERSHLALSFRNDRSVPPEHLTGLVEQARRAGLEPVLVSQVRRDDDQHRRLGDLLGIRTQLWEERTHVEQEEAVRALYRRSAFVVSNRLHGLILGMQCGALPVTYSEPGYDKVVSTVSGVVSISSWPSKDGLEPLTAAWLVEDRADSQDRLESELQAAEQRLAALKNEFLRVLAVPGP